MMRNNDGVWFHEDEHCQIELLPIANWEHCLAEVKVIAAFSKAHFDGVGWTDIYLRKENPSPITTVGMTAGEIADRIGGSLSLLSPVRYLDSDHLTDCQGTVAYGTDQDCVVFLDVDIDQRIKNIWLRLDIKTPSQISAMTSAFSALGEKWDLLLVDWGWCCCFKIGDVETSRNYLEKRMQVFSKNV